MKSYVDLFTTALLSVAACGDSNNGAHLFVDNQYGMDASNLRYSQWLAAARTVR